MAQNRDVTIESAIPVVSLNQLLATNYPVDFTGSSSVALPSGTTIGGSAVVSLGNISSSATTGNMFTITNTGIYTGTGVQTITANSATTGILFAVTGNGLTTGALEVLNTTGTYTGAGVQQITANSATSGTITAISGTSLTSGTALSVTGGGANMTSAGSMVSFNMGASTAGAGLIIQSSGLYSGGAGTGLLRVAGTSSTGGFISNFVGTGLTTGIVVNVQATAATLTTGFYFAANDAALNVFTIGANGHLTSNQTTAPTITVTTQAGITAAAVTAGSTDVAGNITTTGTSTGGTIITMTFNKTFTVAPKVIMVTETNAAAVTGGIFTTATATTAVFTIPVASGVNPSFSFFVIA